MDTDAAPLKPIVALQTGLAFAGSQVMKVVDHFARVLWPFAVAQVIAAGVLWERPCTSHLDALLVIQAVIVIVQKYAPFVALAALLVSLLALRSVVDFAPSEECGPALMSGLVVLVLLPLPFLFSRIVFFVRLTVAYLTAIRELQLDSSGMMLNGSRLRASPGHSGHSLSRSASMVSILRTPDMSPKTTRNQLRDGALSPDFESRSYRLLESASPSAQPAPRRDRAPPSEQV